MTTPSTDLSRKAITRRIEEVREAEKVGDELGLYRMSRDHESFAKTFFGTVDNVDVETTLDALIKRHARR